MTAPEPGADPNATAEPTRPNAGRMYDYFLGGTHNFQVDREAAEQVLALSPTPNAREVAWANRGFLQRATRWLAAEAGVSQFIDVGAGLPTRTNTHETVRAVDPQARVVYVDNDHGTVAEGQAMLAGIDGVDYVAGDLRRSAELLDDPGLRDVLDFDRPIALLIVGILYFVADEDEPYDAVDRLVGALPSGSYLAISHFTMDKWDSQQATERAGQSRQIYARTTTSVHHRSRSEVERFFSGLELVPPYAGTDPSVSYCGMWGAEDPELADDDVGRLIYAGVARKP